MTRSNDITEHRMLSCDIIQYHVMSHDIMEDHVTLYNVMYIYVYISGERRHLPCINFKDSGGSAGTASA